MAASMLIVPAIVKIDIPCTGIKRLKLSSLTVVGVVSVESMRKQKCAGGGGGGGGGDFSEGELVSLWEDSGDTVGEPAASPWLAAAVAAAASSALLAPSPASRQGERKRRVRV